MIKVLVCSSISNHLDMVYWLTVVLEKGKASSPQKLLFPEIIN